MHPETFSELVLAITEILPNATFDQDNDGQVIIYTDLELTADDRLVEFYPD